MMNRCFVVENSSARMVASASECKEGCSPGDGRDIRHGIGVGVDFRNASRMILL